MEMGKLNVFYVTSELEIGKITANITSAYFTNTTEEEFNRLLDNYSSENDLDSGLHNFLQYVTKNGYYCTILDGEVLPPSI